MLENLQIRSLFHHKGKFSITFGSCLYCAWVSIKGNFGGSFVPLLHVRCFGGWPEAIESISKDWHTVCSQVCWSVKRIRRLTVTNKYIIVCSHLLKYVVSQEIVLSKTFTHYIRVYTSYCIRGNSNYLYSKL